MGCPIFLATLLRNRQTRWLPILYNRRILYQPRALRVPRRSLLLYSDATPISLAALDTGPPQRTLVRLYDDVKPIHFVEMAAALVALIWAGKHHHQATTFTLANDATVVCYTLCTGRDRTLRCNPLLQDLYSPWILIKMEQGHSLVVRSVPSAENLADPLSRGQLASAT
jgi:hypothetical protein